MLELLHQVGVLNACIAVAMTIVGYYLSQVIVHRRHLAKIPSAKGGLPFFGQMFIMLKGNPWDTMARWAKEIGSIYRITLFGSQSVIVSDPALLKVILHTKMSTFDKDLHWTYKPFLVILGNGLVTSHGESWRRQRNLLSHTLRIDILKDIPHMAERAVMRLRSKILTAVASNSTVEMAEEFRHLTLQVIAEAILSLDPQESDVTFAKMYLPIVEEGNLRTWNPERAFLPTPSWFAFRANTDRLNNYVVSLIKKRVQLLHKEKLAPSNRTHDVLDRILSAVDDEHFTSETIKQIRDEVKTFILAGHETSASMLAWTLFELTKHPALLQRVRNEAKEVFGTTIYTDKTNINKDKLSQLTLTECCLRETLRLYSVVPSVVRVNNAPVDLGEYHLPTGTTVIVNIQGTHHTEWDNAEEYDPERFLGKNISEDLKFLFLPFIDGPRNCLGQHLSLLESKVVLAMLVHMFDFEVTNSDAGEKHPYMVPIIPKTGHFMKMSLRQ